MRSETDERGVQTVGVPDLRQNSRGFPCAAQLYIRSFIGWVRDRGEGSGGGARCLMGEREDRRWIIDVPLEGKNIIKSNGKRGNVYDIGFFLF